jgi:ribosomal protein L11 methyltransferase
VPFLSVALTVDAKRADDLSDQLLEAGAIAVDTEDAQAGTVYERAFFAEPETATEPIWQLVRISALFAEDSDIAVHVARALSGAGLETTLSYTVARIDDQDWVRATQAQFAPVRISRRLWVVPSWHEAPDPSAINLVIDPGLAFGTGTHATTRLCLAWLESTVRGGESVLDYGSGSGILAIAAMKLGARSARGVDVDAAALLAARHNAMQNRVAAEFILPDDASGATADIVVANILARPLQLLAPLLAKATAAGGAIALSGILTEQTAEVSRTYEEWFDMRPAQTVEGWVLLTGFKRARSLST